MRLGTDHVDPVHHMAIKFRVAAHGRVHPITTFDQTGKNVVDIIDRERVICTEIANGAFLSCTQTVPQLTCRIALATKQNVLAVLTSGYQYDNPFRLRKAAEVLEVTVLAINMLDIAITNSHRSRRQNCNAVGDHLCHQRFAATGVFRLRDMIISR